MILRTENEQLLFLIVPIPAKSAKNTRPVIQGMCQDSNLRFAVRNDVASKERVIRCLHFVSFQFDRACTPQ